MTSFAFIVIFYSKDLKRFFSKILFILLRKDQVKQLVKNFFQDIDFISNFVPSYYYCLLKRFIWNSVNSAKKTSGSKVG